MSEAPGKEEMAFMELKSQIVKLMFDFVDKHSNKDTPNNPYPSTGYILVEVLTACLAEAQYQVGDYHPFTSLQRDRICYQIGDWYVEWKDRMWVDGKPNQHWLGVAKEQLKTMICGE